ncbi:MAG TPA: bifunctional DNA-binding transcriptional regulator/O6-methylguanine-DNA methyltransferase Ada [Terriglobales bacterium]|nr:bifunctional DNA-binding transcriptional regulator/O6-methylguanine-DNA methyltransferase Ada [Terriglobales bacterium]
MPFCRRENSFDRNIRIVRAAQLPYVTAMATNAILLEEETMKRTPQPTTVPKAAEVAVQIAVPKAVQTNARRWQAVVRRDGSLDGTFVFAVSSTGIFCRPSCPAKRPRRENVSFFDHALQAEQAGYRACLRCRPKAVDGNPQSALVRSICRYIEQHIEGQLTLSLLAKEFRRSPFHLQRTFKSVLGVSPKAYMDACRLRQVKQNLQAGHSVTTALYAAGYGSSSRLYERTATQLGMTPEKYRRGAVAAVVRYTIFRYAIVRYTGSPLGHMLIAATDKGICAIQFGDSEQQLQQGLMREFPFAVRRRDDVAMSQWRDNLTRLIQGHELNPSLPLDIRATAFQRRVWEALQKIPRGETRSYSAVAKKIGMPKATRAVARACATNPVAVAIPCHRVIRQDGELGGYRWGIERKEQLLAMEKEAGA